MPSPLHQGSHDFVAIAHFETRVKRAGVGAALHQASGGIVNAIPESRRIVHTKHNESPLLEQTAGHWG